MSKDDNDIELSAKALRQWEQLHAKTLQPELKAILNLAAYRLETCHSYMLAAVEDLEQSLKLKIGFSDSDSRKMEISRLKREAVERQIGALRSLLEQRSPTSRAASSAEVI